MRQISFEETLHQTTFKPLNFICLDGKKTSVVFNEQDLVDLVTKRGRQYAADAIQMTIKILDSEYKLTEEEISNYVDVLGKLSKDYLNL